MKLQAVIFDVDGVITDTAALHFNCWKQVFDNFLLQYAKIKQLKFVPFIYNDYIKYVDGISRTNGIKNFLASRQIKLPFGKITLRSIAEQKTNLFLQAIKHKGVKVFPGSINLIQDLKSNDIKVAAVSASKNAKYILKKAHVLNLFDLIIDGKLAHQYNLASKPNPAIFIKAAEQLAVKPEDTVIIEDALAGIKAAKAGNFGLAIAVDRQNKKRSHFKALGANYTVQDLSELNYQKLKKKFDFFCSAIKHHKLWGISYEFYKPEQEKFREALCTLSNGYVATRGAAEEARAGVIHYPGTYLAGCYNKLRSHINNKESIHEDLVNIPNWLTLTFKIGNNSTWFNLVNYKILSFKQKLYLKKGLLKRTLRIQDNDNRITKISFSRFISMANPHIATLKISLLAENWAGKFILKSGLNGSITNAGVKRNRKFSSKHLEPINIGSYKDNSIYLTVRTNQSHVIINEMAKQQLFKNQKNYNVANKLQKSDYSIYQVFACAVKKREIISLEKIVIFTTSKDRAITEPLYDAKILIEQNTNYKKLLNDHIKIWKNLWQNCDVIIDGHANEQRTIRLHIFHLLQTITKHSIDLDVSIPARGLHGEDYQGHIFWDELFILPFYIFHFPDIARAILLYRYRRLDMARYHAKRAGFNGALYPWQSASNGEEVTTDINFNFYSQSWDPDYSRLQYHINAAIVYNIWQYYLATDDIIFIAEYGAEIIFEIARFWASISSFNKKINRYEIVGVVGPDEFHEKYPNATNLGIRNNAYTNFMAVWSIEIALELLKLLPSITRQALIEQLQITEAELSTWQGIIKKMIIPFHNKNIISQFEDYELLTELDWTYYQNKYASIRRLDLILKSEGDTPDRYKVAKQADVLMLFYLFSKNDLQRIFKNLGYRLTNNMIKQNIEYYAKRTSHGSTLSKLVFASVYYSFNEELAIDYYRQDLNSDLTYMTESVTHEGIHLGAMGGCVNFIMQRFAGLQIKHKRLSFRPKLFDKFTQVKFKIIFLRTWYSIVIQHKFFQVKIESDKEKLIKIYCNNNLYQLPSNQWVTITL